MSEREYNKIYSHTDREEGSEKILLGYKNDLAEIILKKDTDTIFHIPLYVDKINVAQSTLVADGATAGPFPAASDRIFKNQKNYGASTPFGNTSDIANGMWYCSWLHKDEYGKVQWKDRIYNPGYFRQNTARTQLIEYVPHNPIYEDVPSKLTLEEGVQYKYHHIGEKDAMELVATYGGLSGEFLKLNLTGWGTETIDTSNVPKEVKIVTDDTNNNIYVRLTDSDKISANNLNFDNNYKTSVSIDYDNTYNFTDEFTLAFWGYSKDWRSSQSTQLVGNYTSKGGYGVFIDTLSSYPFFVIPETAYGHLLFINERFDTFLDRSVHPSVQLTATPSFVAINSDNEVITIEVNKFHKIRKFDHTGVLLHETSLESTPSPAPKTEQEKIGSKWYKNENFIFINKLEVSTDSKIWAAINTENLLTISTDGGLKWELRGENKIKNCKDMAMSETGLMLTIITENNQVWTSSDTGMRWRQTSNIVANLDGIIFNGITLSRDGQIQTLAAANDYLYISFNYGYSWYQKGFINNWKKIVASDEGRFYLALTDDGLYASNNYGDTWFRRKESDNWNAISMSRTGLVQAAVVNGGNIYVSTDYGETWTEKEDTTNDWVSIAVSHTGRILTAIAVQGNYLRIFMSFDYGSTWEIKQLIPKPANIGQVTIKINQDEKTQLVSAGNGNFYISTENNLLSEATLIENPIQLLCGKEDNIIVITDKARYEYDKDLNFQSVVSWYTEPRTIAAYSYDTQRDTAELISVENVYDCKFINTDCYCISATYNEKTDGNLWVKYADTNTFELYVDLGAKSSSSAFGIDPYDRIWLLHDNNKVTVYDSKNPPGSPPVINTFSVGSNMSYMKKNISFMCLYDRTTQTREWRAIIYYGDTGKNVVNPQIFILDMNGKIVRIIDTLSAFDLYTVNILNQKQENMEFLASGDFTGYERKRVFNKLSPYKNTPQIVLRATLRNLSNVLSPYKYVKKYAPIQDWEFKLWQHFTLTLKNRTLVLYNNGLPIITHNYSGTEELSFLTQPSFFIGSPTGSRLGFNYEIGNTTAIFNGSLQDIKIYNYAIEQQNLEMFLRAKIIADDMHWTLPTPMVQYIETIERFFKHKLPGSKSSLFNIKLYGTRITDPITRKLIEEGIRTLVNKLKPAHTDMVGIKWVD